MRPHGGRFAIGFVCILGYVLSTLGLPYLAGQVALYMGQGNVEQMAQWLGLAAILFSFAAFSNIGKTSL